MQHVYWMICWETFFPVFIPDANLFVLLLLRLSSFPDDSFVVITPKMLNLFCCLVLAVPKIGSEAGIIQ